MAFRVPTQTFLLVDLTVNLEKPATYEEQIKQAIKDTAEGKKLSAAVKRRFGYTEDAVVFRTSATAAPSMMLMRVMH